MSPEIDSSASRAALDLDEWSTLFSHYLGISMLPGHSIERLLNGREIFSDMLATIRSASNSIELMSFIL